MADSCSTMAINIFIVIIHLDGYSLYRQCSQWHIVYGLRHVDNLMHNVFIARELKVIPLVSFPSFAPFMLFHLPSLPSEPCERDGICFQAQQSPPGSPPLPNKSGLGRLGYQVSASLMSQGFSVNTPAQPLLGSVSSMDIMQTRPKPNLGDFSYVNQARTSWHEREELKCQIVKDSRLIMRKYASLVLNVYRLLQRNQVPFEEVQIALLHLGCFQSRPNSPTLFPESSELYRAKTIPELVCSLHAYTSWFNYDLIKFLACEEKLGGVDGQLLIGEYEAELREFFSKYIFECPQFSVECEVPPGFQEFEMKIDWDYKTCQAHQVALFKTTVSELLDIKPYALQLKSVEEGCVLTTWIVPSSIVACIVERVLDNEEALSKVNVTLVRIAGKCLEMTSKKSLSHVTQCQTAGHNLFKVIINTLNIF